jgi:hypothetical protein
MPLYTYVVTYKEATYVVQRKRSNFQGFGDWAEALPPALRKNVSLYTGFDPIPNRQSVWRNVQTVDGHDLIIIAVATDS